VATGIQWLDTFYNYIRQFVDDFDLDDDVISSWVTFAEERINNELRVREMVQTREIFLADQCVMLPDDFLEIINVRYRGNGLPLRYVSVDEYWRLRSAAEYYLSGPQTTAITYLDPATGAPLGPLPRQPAFVDYPGSGGPRLPLARNAYTLIGATLFVHPTVNEVTADIDPTQVQLSYYGRVPTIVGAPAPTILYQHAPKLYTYGTLAASAAYFIEDARSQVWDSNVTALIKAMNDNAHTSRVVGSPIVMQIRSFG
jgi:hypothetical protein